MVDCRDEFLGEEDLDIRNMSDEKREVWWDRWLHLAQATNDKDGDCYSHGVFMLMHEPP